MRGKAHATGGLWAASSPTAIRSTPTICPLHTLQSRSLHKVHERCRLGQRYRALARFRRMYAQVGLSTDVVAGHSMLGCSMAGRRSPGASFVLVPHRRLGWNGLYGGFPQTARGDMLLPGEDGILMAGDWRESRVALAAAALALLAAAPGVLAAVGVRNGWVLGGATAVAAVVVVFGAVWQDRYQRRRSAAMRVVSGPRTAAWCSLTAGCPRSVTSPTRCGLASIRPPRPLSRRTPRRGGGGRACSGLRAAGRRWRAAGAAGGGRVRAAGR